MPQAGAIHGWGTCREWAQPGQVGGWVLRQLQRGRSRPHLAVEPPQLRSTAGIQPSCWHLLLDRRWGTCQPGVPASSMGKGLTDLQLLAGSVPPGWLVGCIAHGPSASHARGGRTVGAATAGRAHPPRAPAGGSPNRGSLAERRKCGQLPWTCWACAPDGGLQALVRGGCALECVPPAPRAAASRRTAAAGRSWPEAAVVALASRGLIPLEAPGRGSAPVWWPAPRTPRMSPQPSSATAAHDAVAAALRGAWACCAARGWRWLGAGAARSQRAGGRGGA